MESPTSPQFSNQAPPRPQQLRLPFLVTPHLGQVAGGVIIAVVRAVGPFAGAGASIKYTDTQTLCPPTLRTFTSTGLNALVPRVIELEGVAGISAVLEPSASLNATTKLFSSVQQFLYATLGTRSCICRQLSTNANTDTQTLYRPTSLSVRIQLNTNLPLHASMPSSHV